MVFVCGNSFEEGTLRCSRCETTHYKDVENQKKHWKIHKSVCALVEDPEKARIYAMSLDEATEYFGRTLLREKNDTVYVLKHIRQLFDSKADDPNDVEMKLHSICRGTFLISPSDMSIRKFYARPGMTNYLLTNNDEDLLNEKTRITKAELSKYNGVPDEDFIDNFIEDPTEKARVKAACEAVEKASGSMGWGQTPASMKFCYVYYNLICGAAIQGESSMSSIHDGRGRLRGNKLAKAALTRAMELWADPYVRASCGDAMAPAASLALTAMLQQGDKFGCEGYQLIPGLSVDEAVLACLSELGELAGSAQYSFKLLERIAHAEPETSYYFWCTMPLAKRARVARAVVCYMLLHGLEHKEASYSEVGIPTEALQLLVYMACETEDADDNNVRREVWRMCAEDAFLGPGPCGQNNNHEPQAYFHFLLRLTEHDHDKMLMAKATIVEWVNTPWPRKGQERSAMMLEKKACMALVQGEKCHAQWSQFMFP